MVLHGGSADGGRELHSEATEPGEGLTLSLPASYSKQLLLLALALLEVSLSAKSPGLNKDLGYLQWEECPKHNGEAELGKHSWGSKLGKQYLKHTWEITSFSASGGFVPKQPQGHDCVRFSKKGTAIKQATDAS